MVGALYLFVTDNVDNLVQLCRSGRRVLNFIIKIKLILLKYLYRRQIVQTRQPKIKISISLGRSFRLFAWNPCNSGIFKNTLIDIIKISLVLLFELLSLFDNAFKCLLMLPQLVHCQAVFIGFDNILKSCIQFLPAHNRCAIIRKSNPYGAANLLLIGNLPLNTVQHAQFFHNVHIFFDSIRLQHEFCIFHTHINIAYVRLTGRPLQKSLHLLRILFQFAQLLNGVLNIVHTGAVKFSLGLVTALQAVNRPHFIDCAGFNIRAAGAAQYRKQ